jgi:hypothetical protein
MRYGLIAALYLDLLHVRCRSVYLKNADRECAVQYVYICIYIN